MINERIWWERVSIMWSFRNLLKSSSGQLEKAVDLQQAARQAICQLSNELEPLGFVRTQNRIWVESFNAPYRKVVHLQSFKGASDSIAWGYSFDFSPVTDNQVTRLKWARTDRTATLMLAYQPVWRRSGAHAREMEISAFSSEKQNTDNLRNAIAAASEWFKKTDTLQRILQEFDDWELDIGSGLGYMNHIHAPLAHAFCLAEHGNKRSSLEKVSMWAETSRPLPELIAKIHALLESRLEAAVD
jgi:hypothetical protein